MKKLVKKSLENLIQENKEEILKDKQALEEIEQRIEERHEPKKLA
ncbi:MAG TPA: FbpB family small basic protein [Chondromyces sp.]|nr:FbpB family small basic protein [Chondromyces sp.]